MSERLVAILMHGTFAPNAPWTKPTSALSKALIAEVGVERVDTLQWGRFNNTFRARFAACEKLAKMLSSLDSNTKAVICAHSHAGAAVCYALARYPHLVAKVHLAVFFSTPFVSCRLLLEWRKIYDAYISNIIALCVVLLAVASAGFVASVAPKDIGEVWVVWSIIAAGICIVVSEVLLQAMFRVDHPIQRAIRKIFYASKQAARDRSCDLPNEIDAMFVRLSGDEASTGLVTSQAAAWLSLRINMLFASITSLLIPLHRIPLRRIRAKNPALVRVAVYFASVPILASLTFFSLYLWMSRRQT